MITSWDDYFVHQTAEPIARTTPALASFMDRMYFNAHDPAGRWMLGVGLGQYRATSRMDAIAYLLTPGEQRVLRFARSTGPDDYADPRVGTLSFTVVAPLEHWRAELAVNDSGVEWELDFHAPRPPVAFAPFDFGEGADSSRYRHFVQLGRVSGSVRCDGELLTLDGGLALRDRSWGVRRSRERQGLHLWLQHSFDDLDVHLIYNEARDGSVAYLDGAVVDAAGEHRIVAVGHELEFVESTRDVAAGVVTVVDDRGGQFDLHYRRLLAGYVGGVGYGGFAGADHPDGMFEHERIDLGRPVADVLAEQSMLLFDHLCEIVCGGRRTVGSFQLGITRSPAYQYRPRTVPR